MTSQLRNFYHANNLAVGNGSRNLVEIGAIVFEIGRKCEYGVTTPLHLNSCSTFLTDAMMHTIAYMIAQHKANNRLILVHGLKAFIQ